MTDLNMSPDQAKNISNARIGNEEGVTYSSDDVRWVARRKTAIWSFRMMCGMAITILLYGMFYPGGDETVNQLFGVITFLFGTFGALVAAYMGVDAFSVTRKTKK